MGEITTSRFSLDENLIISGLKLVIFFKSNGNLLWCIIIWSNAGNKLKEEVFRSLSKMAMANYFFGQIEILTEFFLNFYLETCENNYISVLKTFLHNCKNKRVK